MLARRIGAHHGGQFVPVCMEAPLSSSPVWAINQFFRHSPQAYCSTCMSELFLHHVGASPKPRDTEGLYEASEN